MPKLTVAFIAPFTLLAACSSSAVEPQVKSESIEIAEESLAEAQKPQTNLVGLAADSLDELAKLVADEYSERGTITLNQASEPVSAVSGILEVVWDVTGFDDELQDGERIIATISVASAEYADAQITNAIIQPICSNRLRADGQCS